jgi:hypothetical protein
MACEREEKREKRETRSQDSTTLTANKVLLLSTMAAALGGLASNEETTI